MAVPKKKTRQWGLRSVEAGFRRYSVDKPNPRGMVTLERDRPWDNDEDWYGDRAPSRQPNPDGWEPLESSQVSDSDARFIDNRRQRSPQRGVGWPEEAARALGKIWQGTFQPIADRKDNFKRVPSNELRETNDRSDEKGDPCDNVREPFGQNLRVWLTISAISAVGGLLLGGAFWVNRKVAQTQNAMAAECPSSEIRKPNAILSEERLGQLKNYLGNSRSTVTKELGTPYCSLPRTSIRAGAIIERDVYLNGQQKPLVLAYEDGKLIGYGMEPSETEPVGQKEINLKQNWGIRMGTSVAGRPVVSGLGNLSIAASGPVYAPADGLLYRNLTFVTDNELIEAPEECVAFASPQMPAYLFQLCGIDRQRQGLVRRGERLGKTNGYLHFALLRHNGQQWMFVPPAPEVFDQLLHKS